MSAQINDVPQTSSGTGPGGLSNLDRATDFLPGSALTLGNLVPFGTWVDELHTFRGAVDGSGCGIGFGFTDMVDSVSQSSSLGRWGFGTQPGGYDSSMGADGGDFSYGGTIVPGGGTGTGAYKIENVISAHASGYIEGVCYAALESMEDFKNRFGSGGDFQVPGPAQYLYLGNLCKAKAGEFTLNSATGNQSVTGVGFKPDLVIFAWGAPNQGVATHGTSFFVGCMDKDGNQWAVAIRSAHLSTGNTQTAFANNCIQGGTVRMGQFHDDACIAHIGSQEFAQTTTVDQLAHFVSMDSDGFTIDLTAAGLDQTATWNGVTYTGGHPSFVGFLALKPDASHGSLKCGVGVQGDAAIACGFAPDAIVVAHANSETTALRNFAKLGLGAVTAAKQRASWVGANSSGVDVTAAGASSYGSNTSTIFFADVAPGGVAASTTLTSDGTTPADGDQVTVGHDFSSSSTPRDYTFKTTLTGAAYEVHINGSAAAALANLKKAINASGVAGTDYGTGTLVNATVTAATLTSTTLQIAAINVGAFGNSIPSTDTSAHLSFPGTTLSGGADGATVRTVQGEAAATLTGTGASLNWTTNDAVARKFGWIAMKVDTNLNKAQPGCIGVIFNSAHREGT